METKNVIFVVTLKNANGHARNAIFTDARTAERKACAYEKMAGCAASKVRQIREAA